MRVYNRFSVEIEQPLVIAGVGSLKAKEMIFVYFRK